VKKTLLALILAGVLFAAWYFDYPIYTLRELGFAFAQGDQAAVRVFGVESVR
jgi:hypothetical protein